ncbi:MAG: hypothetical protein C4519_13315 [Desulfobacteraceae bacterium]|nr:MAG: hypothetical protein C4519_13315 [Desulfobacteraceae bacterium]
MILIACARSALFAIAETHAVDSERGLLQALKEKKIAYVLMDTSPAFDQWSQLSRQYEVRSTPTCIVLKPGQQEIRYTGSLDIPAGIDMLIKELTPDI